MGNTYHVGTALCSDKTKQMAIENTKINKFTGKNVSPFSYEYLWQPDKAGLPQSFSLSHVACRVIVWFASILVVQLFYL